MNTKPTIIAFENDIHTRVCENNPVRAGVNTEKTVVALLFVNFVYTIVFIDCFSGACGSAVTALIADIYVEVPWAGELARYPQGALFGICLPEMAHGACQLADVTTGAQSIISLKVFNSHSIKPPSLLPS